MNPNIHERGAGVIAPFVPLEEDSLAPPETDDPTSDGEGILSATLAIPAQENVTGQADIFEAEKASTSSVSWSAVVAGEHLQTKLLNGGIGSDIPDQVADVIEAGSAFSQEHSISPHVPFEEAIRRAFDENLCTDGVNERVLRALRWTTDRNFERKVKQIFEEAKKRGGIAWYLDDPAKRQFFIEMLDVEDSRNHSSYGYQGHQDVTCFYKKEKQSAVFDELAVVATKYINEFGVAPEFVANICCRNWRRFSRIVALGSKVAAFVSGGIRAEDLWGYVCFVFSFDEFKMPHSVGHNVFCSSLCGLSCQQAASLLSTAHGSQFVVQVVESFVGLPNTLVDYSDCVDHKQFWTTVSHGEFTNSLLGMDIEDQLALEQALLLLIQCAPPRFQRPLIGNVARNCDRFWGSDAAPRTVQSYETAWRRSQRNLEAGDEKDEKKTALEWTVEDLISWLRDTEWGTLMEKTVARVVDQLQNEAASVDVTLVLDVENGQTHPIHGIFSSKLQWRKFVSQVKLLHRRDEEILALRQLGIPTRRVNLPQRAAHVEINVCEDDVGTKEEIALANGLITSLISGLQSRLNWVYQGFTALAVSWIAEIVARWQNAREVEGGAAPNLAENIETPWNFRGQPRGLPNLGNTCFMNSGLQCISQTPIFADMILRLDIDALDKARQQNFKAWHVLERYRELLVAVNCVVERAAAGGESTNRSHGRQKHWRWDCVDRRVVQRYHDALADFCALYREYRQLDAFESVSVLLDAIHDATKQQNTGGSLAVEHGRHLVDLDADGDELKRELMVISYRELSHKFDEEYSIINKLFFGYYGVFEQCLECQASFFHLEPWKCVDICLDPLVSDFKLAFEAIEAPQSPSLGDYDWTCPSGGCKSGVTMWKKFLNVPPILLIHVSRCHLSVPFSKITEALNYPETFELKTLSGTTVEYENYGVCLHSGSTIRVGHYTAAVKVLHGVNEGMWVYANDSSVKGCGRSAPIPDGREIALFYVAKI